MEVPVAAAEGELTHLTSTPMRIHRKRWALSQRELGHLLGGLNDSTVAKMELGRLAPSLPVMLRYQIIFGAGPAELLADLYAELEDDVMRRAATLSTRWQTNADGAHILKRKLLKEMVSRAGARRLGA